MGLSKELRRRKTKGNCLDIGAGLGRFLPVWKSLFKEIVMIEPADSLWRQLHKHDNGASIRCFPNSFEDFFWTNRFNLIFASGVMYFLDAPSLVSFLVKCFMHASPDGILIIRDFVPPDRSIMCGSVYAPGCKCYYRNIDEWDKISTLAGWKLVSVSPSKPHYSYFHNWIDAIRFQKLLCMPGVPGLMSAIASRRLLPGTINTVFMVFEQR